MNHCGKMKLLLSSLLLCSFWTPSSWSVSSDTIVVKQTPDVSVSEGETINITCCWIENIERTRVFWLKNQTFIKNETIIKPQESLNQQAENCSTLTFPNITRKDSGRYICRVFIEIPVFKEVEGNGTIITVTSRENKHANIDHREDDGFKPPISVIISLGVVVPLFLIALLCFCSLRRNQAQAARVIYEVPHINSEEIEMDKHSTSSSRSSSQWCQVPVYESFDYFERVETKGSG
ncbi:uncharacterized protein LOC121640387 [Melanotaenia boesemani]|uniref:uncharacterized protein LOC121640387 n=1 Tax=Melanotaenia boesemani TaxID=1250792 RepID=UPI001C05EB8E|nr:uncharacterized protein LOC121640387 [Melanotaenia boesemani]